MKFTVTTHQIFMFMSSCLLASYDRTIELKNNQVTNKLRLDRFFYARVSGYRKPLIKTNPNMAAI